MMYGWGFGSGLGGWGTGLGGWVMMLGGLALLVGFVLLVVWAVGAVSRGARVTDAGKQDLAATTLRQRYARGEISETEFEQASKTLGL